MKVKTKEAKKKGGAARVAEVVDTSVLQMDLSSLDKVTNDVEPGQVIKQGFAKSLFKISKEELGKVITICDDKCPKALSKNASEDEVSAGSNSPSFPPPVINPTATTLKTINKFYLQVEINVDLIFPRVFWEIHEFMRMCGYEDGKKTKKKKQ